MFSTAPRNQSTAEHARIRAASTVSAAAQYASSADTWFDGSVDSVDSRLAMCDKLLHQTRSSLGMGGFGNPAALSRLASLETDQAGLRSLREDLTHGSAYRVKSSAVAMSRSAAKRLERLSPEHRRYVELEAAKILRANADCSDHDELAERTYRIASADLSSMSAAARDELTQALVARTVQLARRTRPAKRTAAAPAPVQDFPTELMYF